MEKGLGLSRVIALFTLIILAACNYRPAQNTDAQFKEQVLEIMPGFALTEEVFGRPVVRANGYGQLAITGSGSETKPLLEGFFMQFEEGGLRSFEFGFFLASRGELSFHSTDFPGCTPALV